MSTNKLVKIALMTAVSCVLLMIIRIPFPPAPFLVYDPADIPIYITAFAYGPVAGLIVTFIVCFLQAFALGGDGMYGFIMHFIATGAFAVIAGYIYSKNKTKKTAAISLAIGVVVCIAIMCVLNLYITAAYMGVDRSVIAGMLGTVIIPFNLIKAGVNAILTFILYKRISRFLHNDGSTTKGNL